MYNPDAADVGEDAVAYTMTDTATDTPSTETLSDLCSPAPDSSALNDDSLSTYKYALESSRENALPGSLLWRTMIGITTVIILILFTLYVLNAPGKHTASVKTGPAATESSKPSAVAGEDNLPDAVSEPDIKMTIPICLHRTMPIYPLRQQRGAKEHPRKNRLPCRGRRNPDL